MNTELVPNSEQSIARRDEPTTLDIIHEALVNPAVSVDKLRGLMDLQERSEAKAAERAFNAAFAAMKDVLPRVGRDDVRAAAREMLHERIAPTTEAEAADEIVAALRSMRATLTGRPTSKSQGVEWGLTHLDPRWHASIRTADAVRRGVRARGSALRAQLPALVRSLRATDRATRP